MASVDPLLHALLRGLLAFVLLRAAWHKLRHPADFRRALADYALLPGGLVSGAARALPLLELATAVALASAGWATVAAPAAAVLLALYSGAIAINLVRGRRIDCGCSGPAAGRPLGPGLLLRNGVLLALALTAAASPGPRPLGAFDLASGVCALVAAALLYLAVDGALANAPRLRALRGVA